MEAKFTLPPEITQGASARGNEYGPDSGRISPSTSESASTRLLLFGCTVSLRLDEGPYEMYWLNANSTERRGGESWAEVVRRSCDEVLDSLQRRRSKDRFPERSFKLAFSGDCGGSGLNIVNHLVFVAYLATESELAARGF